MTVCSIVIYTWKEQMRCYLNMFTNTRIKRKIIKVWLEYFGYVKSSTIDYNLEGDMQEIIEIFLEDIDDFVAVEPSGYDWASFWSELHKLKGTLNILQELRNNTDIIALIESMRENNFDPDLKTYGLVYAKTCSN